MKIRFLPAISFLLLGAAVAVLALSAFAAGIDGQWTATLDSVKDIMNGPLTTASDVVFGAVETDVDASGTHKTVPQTDAQWTEIKKSAAMIIEDGNLILVPGRIRDEAAWVTQTQAMIESAKQAMMAAENKDPDGVFAAGAAINRSCDRCHNDYPEQEDSHAPGAPITDTGTPHYTFTFKAEGQKLTGTVQSESGQTQIQNGTINGDAISFADTMVVQGRNVPVTYTGKISDNEIKLTRKIGDLASEALVATRAK